MPPRRSSGDGNGCTFVFFLHSNTKQGKVGAVAKKKNISVRALLAAETP